MSSVKTRRCPENRDIYLSKTPLKALINLQLCAIKRTHFEIKRLICDMGNRSLKRKSYGESVNMSGLFSPGVLKSNVV